MTRTRRLTPVALALMVAGAAALPASAQAGARADYEHRFTTRSPGASTGIDTRIVYKHPDDSEAKPIPVRKEVFRFPKGTRFNGVIVPNCTASDLELQLFGEAACPPESHVGKGHDGTFMTGFPGAGETPMDLDMFDDGAGFIVLGSPRERPDDAVGRPRDARGAGGHRQCSAHARRTARRRERLAQDPQRLRSALGRWSRVHPYSAAVPEEPRLEVQASPRLGGRREHGAPRPHALPAPLTRAFLRPTATLYSRARTSRHG